MASVHNQSEPEFRDDVLTLKDKFTIAIAKEPQNIEWVLLDGRQLPVWWKYANGDLEHELQTATTPDKIAQFLSTGQWQHIQISEDTKQHRERMLFTYGSQPAVEPYNEVTTLEFEEKPDPNLVLPVFRLYDVTTDKVSEYGDESKAAYVALSHVWNQSTDDKLREACERARTVTGHTRFWVDRWCIKQTSIEDKAFHVPRMRDYYMHAAAVLVVAPDLAVLPDTTNDEDFVESLRRTRWFSRVWTFQEAMSSKRLLLDNGEQCWDHKTVESQVRRCHGSRARTRYPHVTSSGDTIQLNDDLWIDTQGRLTMAISDILYSTGGRLWNIMIVDEKAKVSLTRLIHQTQYRRCRLEEDRFYGVMGLAHATSAVDVQYGIGFTQAMLKAAESGALDSKILAGNSVNPFEGACWLPDTKQLGRQETLQQLSSQGRQTLRPGKRPNTIQVWCSPKLRQGDIVDNIQQWVVQDKSPDRIVLSLRLTKEGVYHRKESHVEMNPATTGEPKLLEIGFLKT